MKRFMAQMSVSSGVPSDIPGPAGLWHFPEKVPREGKKTLHQPTHLPTLPSQIPLPSGTRAGSQLRPLPGGPSPAPTERVGGGRVTLGGPGEYKVCVGYLGGERSFFHRLEEESTSVPSSESGVEKEGR